MSITRTASQQLCARGHRPAVVAPFRCTTVHASRLKALAACTKSSSQQPCQSEGQQQPSTTAPSSAAVFLARSAFQLAEQGARELLASPYSLLAAAALLLYLAPTDTAAAADSVHQHQPLYTVAEGGEEFWSNMARYGRYFVTVLLGTGYVMVKPVLEAFKKPVSAVLAITAIVGGSILLKFTLNAMLGIDEPFDYEPGNVVPYSP